MNIRTYNVSRAALLRGSGMGTALLAVGMATVVLAPVRVHAEDFSGRSEHVSLRNLDLNSAKGARRAYTRIKAAALSVCEEQDMNIEVMMRGPGECVLGAIARAVQDAQSAELTKVYINKNGPKLAKLYGIGSPVVTAGNSK